MRTPTIALAMTVLLTAAPTFAAAAPVDFSRQVRPILSNNCFKCHGPDAGERKSGLRLDARAEALGPAKSGRAAIVPGRPGDSRLVERIFSQDPDELMPPPASGKRLSEAEKELLRRWIAEGAKYEEHWAFRPPVRPAVPVVKDPSWARREIDRFLLARLEASGLRPSPEADRATLIRRAALDLTGLPPLPERVAAFESDSAPDAYERVIDRLLASPRHGERMALEWLDAARYADTNGYHIDNGRDMTRWREWVIDSFNRDVPFDQFTVEQIAGDLLPGATLEQRIASGFHRNHMINFEGGAIPEEYHTAYIVDRVNTTATVWLGLTIGCAQCHDHKYDPITQKEYYQLYAFFHNVPESGLDGYKGNSAPFISTPTPAQARELDGLVARISEVEAWIGSPEPALDAAQARWEETAADEGRVEWTLLDPVEFRSTGGAELRELEDRSILASGANPAVETYTVATEPATDAITAVRLEVLPDQSLPAKGPGRSENGNIVLTDFRLEVSVRAVSGAGAPGPGGPAPRRVKVKSASADFSQKDFPVANAADDKNDTGWAIHPETGKPHAAVFELEEPIRGGAGARLTVTLAFQSGSERHQAGRFRLAATSSPDPHGESAPPEKIIAALAVPRGQRTAAEAAELRMFFRSRASPEGRTKSEELVKLRKLEADLRAKVRTTMVMAEMEQPRETFSLVRGQYDKKGEKVTAGVPMFLPRLLAEAPGNRLGLARWLVEPSHPLTARVIVNRWWQMYFGTGMVKTAEDFGSQGDPPSHPDLLDWLATELSGSGWGVKRLQRRIVTSAAYRQSSTVAAALLEKDPENRLLARGPRLRLPAELIRDQALAASGLLDGRIGGASVFPYQPPGLWEELMAREDGANWTAQTYVQSHGRDLYRRTMYTFWKRTSPPPTLGTFDAPDRETCTVRRARTNTPLQALILMNDPTYVEASRQLAERMLKEAGEAPGDRIAYAYALVLARRPRPEEAALLASLAAEQLAAFHRDGEAARRLLTVGESPWDERLDTAELAAWTMAASAIFNLDEAVTRG